MLKQIRNTITSILLVSASFVAGCASSTSLNVPPPSATNAAAANPSATISSTISSGNGLPSKIALLLPLTGPLSPTGQAVRNGFFAASYQAQQQGYAPTITVYDTNAMNVVQAYQQAVAQGAQFIVGPLLKDQVSALVSAHVLSVPTLALNNLDDNSDRITNLYQFGLSPVDEAIQAANKIQEDDHSAVAIMVPNAAWGQRLARAFELQSSQIRQPAPVAVVTYDNSIASLTTQISQLLGIQQANARHDQISRVLGQNTRFIPRRRHDIDAIFLVATPNMGREIIPLLKFYYADNIPVYSTSAIYSGVPNANLDRDLDSVNFDDMPWVLGNLPSNLASIQQNLQSLWGAAYYRNVRLYALGIDAYNLIPKLNTLASSSANNLAGASGNLYLLSNLHIYRQLTWAKMVNGVPQV